MSGICEMICLGYGAGFVVIAIFVMAYINDQRAVGRKGFVGMRHLHAIGGAVVAAALWPLIVAVLAVDAVKISLAEKGGGT